MQGGFDEGDDAMTVQLSGIRASLFRETAGDSACVESLVTSVHKVTSTPLPPGVPALCEVQESNPHARVAHLQAREG